MLRALVVLVALSLPAMAADKPLPYNTPVQTELGGVFNGLVNQLHEADKLVAQLKSTATKEPSEAKQAVDGAAQSISGITDRLSPSSDLMNALSALRNAAAVHLKRVTGLSKDEIDEESRTLAINAWNGVLQKCDKAQIEMTDMRAKLVNLLSELRKRETGISELVLAGQYQAAIDALRHWIGDLDVTVKNLHKQIDVLKPGV